MANSDLSSVVEQLACTSVNDDFDLNFSGKGLKLDEEKDAEEIVTAINKCKILHTLILQGNTLGVGAAKAIAKALESHPEFKKALWKDMFTGRLKSEIPEALNFLSSGLMLAGARLVELDLSDNAFGPVGVQGIQVLLESSTCYGLRELRLNNNGLGIGGGKMLAEALLRCYSNSGNTFSLKVFICGRNRLENEGATALAGFFKVVGSLEEVSMPQNGIYHDGVSALAEALSANEQLKILNLNDNTVTEIGARALARTMARLNNLEIVNLGDCLLRNDGARALARVFSNGHEKLQEIHLGFNEIETETALIVIESLRNKPFLTKVDLDGNHFGMDGCRKVEKAFEKFEMTDVLGSLLEDEGGDDDDDEDGDDDFDQENYDDNEEDEDEEEIVIPTKHSIANKVVTTPSAMAAVKPQTTTVPTAREFLESPTVDKLMALGNNRVQKIVGEIGNDMNFDRRIHTVLKIASVVSLDNENAKIAACECADALLIDVFDSAQQEGRLAVLSNSLLVQLGLIKNEDKSFKPVSDLMGPLIVLEHVVKQPYFSRITKEILQLFLSRPNKAVESCGNAKHKLMQSLYRF